MDQASFQHYLTYVSDKDDEHRRILELFNQCITACKAKDQTLAKKLLAEAIVSWEEHVIKEEAFMREIKFPYIGSHQEDHVAFSKRLHNFTYESEYAIQEITTRLITHIDHYDLQYAKWYKDSKNKSE